MARRGGLGGGLGRGERRLPDGRDAMVPLVLRRRNGRDPAAARSRPSNLAMRRLEPRLRSGRPARRAHRSGSRGRAQHRRVGHGEGFSRVRAMAAPPETPYVVRKGSIAIDRVSLTVANVGRRGLAVSLSRSLSDEPRSARQGRKTINLEIDVLAKYVEKLAVRAPGARPSAASRRPSRTSARGGWS